MDEELRELENEVIECHIIRFCMPMMQKTAYELWLKDQKTDMHLKCARFLEDRAHKCDYCHGGDFIPCHHFMVDIRLNSLDMDSIRKMANFQELKRKCSSFIISPNRSCGARVSVSSPPRPWAQGGMRLEQQSRRARKGWGLHVVESSRSGLSIRRSVGVWG